ncbi:hypothetical protein QYE76_058693 [Lolium multiflorum]|uniref:Integrase catalytic domain-containing protein n=1 Tax=Lolium multiflorum TaxID=4521 RepID=A0AAD8T6R4_LOLMU|nr:hypothetical protein QYE76_058693 [Lolium multiflorum]
MMQKCLATQIGKNIQVCINDVVITTKQGSSLIDDLRETFDNLDKFHLKLNPTKCSFGVPAGELLGYLVSARGIEANPEEIQAILTMRKPTKLKEIHQLTGRVATLSRFVARLGEKALPFYALIKQGEKFEWNEEADKAFEHLKHATLAVNFIKGIVFRFGVPNSIVTDNGSNFTSREFKDYCEGVGIKLRFASVAHPQSNGQVEKANGLICNGIKKRLLAPLEKARHAWVDELPSVLWSLRTTPNAATQETPFFLVHGAEAVLPIEIEHNSPRVVEYEEEASQRALKDDVDAVDEARDVVLSRVSAYQQNLKNYHSRRLRPRSFEVGDLVLRLKQDGHEKLESPWLGPYIVPEVIPGGAYRLKDKKTGKDEGNPWNVAQLRRFYA